MDLKHVDPTWHVKWKPDFSLWKLKLVWEIGCSDEMSNKLAGFDRENVFQRKMMFGLKFQKANQRSLLNQLFSMKYEQQYKQKQ